MEQDEHEEQDGRRYKAPALEKGLDILELLANARDPMSFTTIADQLDRSRGELHRMVQVLQFRGYIEQDSASEGFRLTDRLFSLGMRQPRTRNLVELALPVMRRLVQESSESCHLALHSRGEIVVVARVESGEHLGFSVRVGYRRPLPWTASGTVLYAFQSDAVRTRWEGLFDPPLSTKDLHAFRAHADAIRAAGLEQMPSPLIAGVIDTSVPILRSNAAAAALTVPYLERRQPLHTAQQVAAMAQAAARQIADQLIQSDERL
ncbi:IclR family transcriptional regulator [Sphingomonas sp. CARO-RG-8B-R24-01]|uniref:IclR family transcriptional regulator n=1 Tax=Sphingomonas sp. CARO-RG-8B-R24-01 TaxID=2914831 RepID=UPI001F56DCF5|nr:IclR family transcriptional regulator [Sphingomonas sp. CARO-RG-8B-R24-01]